MHKNKTELLYNNFIFQKKEDAYKNSKYFYNVVISASLTFKLLNFLNKFIKHNNSFFYHNIFWFFAWVSSVPRML